MADEGLSLEKWANFYLLTSAAAATLIGLLFVVITLAADRRPRAAEKIHLYLTPTVVYFSSVLCLGALLTMPNHSRLTAAACSCLVGAVGMLYSASRAIGKGGHKPEYYEPSDVIKYVVLPCASYALLIVGGALLWHAAQRGLTFVAVGMLVLMTLALRNSWAIAVDVVSTPPENP